MGISMRDRFSLLDPLRLFAALAVVLFHYTYRGAAADGLTTVAIPAWQPVTQYGYLGVQLFFVISGFVIAMSAQGRTPGAFVLARFTRIYPGFVACMTVSFAVITLFGAPVFTAGLKQWAANLIILSPALHQPFIDGVYWSIVYEIVFYGWVTLLLFRGVFVRHLEFVALCWIGLSAVNEILGPSMAVKRLLLTDASGFFIAGMMIHRIRSTGSGLWQWVVLALSIELACGQAIIMSRYNHVHYGADLSNTIIVAVSLASVALVGLCAYSRRSILPPAVGVAVGGLTYPLYLLHQTIGFVLFNRLASFASPVVLVTGAIALMIGLSLAIFFCVERPAQARLKRLFGAITPFGAPRWLGGRPAKAQPGPT